jgi:ribonuclease-3
MRFFDKILPFNLTGRSAYGELENLLGYRFKNTDFLKLALSHRSYVNIQHKDKAVHSNERLEFLGDAVLDLVITDYLYNHYPGEREGFLSKMKSLIVSSRVLALSSARWNLGRYMKLSRSEAKSGGRRRGSILGDAYEAVLGAVYLDGGLTPAVKLVHSSLIPLIQDVLNDEDFTNYKSGLLEYTQSQSIGLPDYRVLKEWGPEHNKIFRVGVFVQDSEWGRGEGNSKKSAEQSAARMALEKQGIETALNGNDNSPH